MRTMHFKKSRITGILTVPTLALFAFATELTAETPKPYLPPPIQLSTPVNEATLNRDSQAFLRTDAVNEVVQRAAIALSANGHPAKGITGRVRTYSGEFNAAFPSDRERQLSDPQRSTRSATFEVEESGSFWESPRLRMSKFISDGMFYGATTHLMDASTGVPKPLISYRHGIVRDDYAWENNGFDGSRPNKYIFPGYSAKRELEFIPVEFAYLSPTTMVPSLAKTVQRIGAPLDVPIWVETQVSGFSAQGSMTDKGRDRYEIVLTPREGATTQTLVVEYDEQNPSLLRFVDSQKELRGGGWVRDRFDVEVATTSSGIRYVERFVRQQWVFRPEELPNPVLTAFSWKVFEDVKEVDEFPPEFFQTEWSDDSIPMPITQRTE